MIITEEHKDLFTVNESYYLAHCIASDLRMGAGIAVSMNRVFGLRKMIMQARQSTDYPTCILTGRVFNLITKEYSGGKPIYASLEDSLRCMEEIVVKCGIKKIAMPRIGCGLDLLEWRLVKPMIEEIFDDLDLEILVCVLGGMRDEEYHL